MNKVYKDIFKNTKLWMYLPFAVFYGYHMSRWVFDPDSYYERCCRMIFSYFSMFLTIIYIIVVLKIFGFTV